MLTFRGDAHKFYLKLREVSKDTDSFKQVKELEEIQKIKDFYNTMDNPTLKLVYFRIVKERNGTGMIPVFVTAIPWFLFLFSGKLQEFLFQHGHYLWLLFGIFYILTLTASVLVHFKEKAWAVMHIEIIQDIIAERNESGDSSPTEN
ncbi:hypothetical protein KO561_14345 [Radiobacillus kanasensis]|uniref:hypothetical protein n=1 Tax=Radiobacillus kanasensis TaxID=2844358 RepID=UPI001E5B6240|nr:hypothetical protein [Radiobacillus kanasensis]UFT98371.1 hypothetical protein KO561_14345 [Radiobacillus kanasensis]